MENKRLVNTFWKANDGKNLRNNFIKKLKDPSEINKAVFNRKGFSFLVKDVKDKN